MGDLQEIIPARFKASLMVGRSQTYIVYGVVIGSLCLVCVIFAALLAHSTVSRGGREVSDGAVVMGLKQLTPPVMETAAWMSENIDHTVDTCDNFYKFACGGWEAKQTVPSTGSRVDIYTHLEKDNEEKLLDIIDSPIQRNTPDSVERKLKTFFRMCLNDYERYKEGGKKLVDINRHDLGGWYLLDPEGWSAQWDLQKMIVRLQGEYLVPVFFGLSFYRRLLKNRKTILVSNYSIVW